MRKNNRELDQLREVTIKAGWNPYAEGSVEVSYGNTKILVTASCSQDLPKWKTDQSGWITAEYSMLPRSTHTRIKREQNARAKEIQRLIGRSLRMAVDLDLIPNLSIRIDCDVIVADGGTRTASISGAWVALYLALKKCVKQGLLDKMPKVNQIAAVSVGNVDGQKLLDLCYEEDSNAEFDLNLVFNSNMDLIEIQGTAETKAVPLNQINEYLELAGKGIEQILAIQKETIEKN